MDRSFPLPFIEIVAPQLLIDRPIPEEMVDDDQNGVGHGDKGALGASSSPHAVGRRQAAPSAAATSSSLSRSALRMMGLTGAPSCISSGRIVPSGDGKPRAA